MWVAGVTIKEHSERSGVSANSAAGLGNLGRTPKVPSRSGPRAGSGMRSRSAPFGQRQPSVRTREPAPDAVGERVFFILAGGTELKVIEHLERAKEPLISFEIIPPLRGGDVRHLLSLIEDLVEFRPPFIDITSHAAEVVYEEGAGGLFAGGVPHYQLYLRVGEAFGISPTEMYATRFEAGALAFRGWFERICRKSFLEGYAALSLGSEAQVPGVSGKVSEVMADDLAAARYTLNHADSIAAAIADVARTQDDWPTVNQVLQRLRSRAATRRASSSTGS